MKIITIVLAAFLFTACTHLSDKPGFPLLGTKTAVVQISVDRSGKPRVNVEDVYVKVGSRIVWVGPKDFTIDFPNKSPFDKNKFKTNDAVLNLVVPESARDQFDKNANKTKFKYDVIVNSKRLDPHIIVVH